MDSIPAINVNNLTKRFGSKTVVDNVSFQIQRGEVFGLLGPNGAGKTTILRMMTTLLRPTAGTVSLFGNDTIHDSRAARATFGLTGQYASVDEDISARENLMIFSRLNGLSRHDAKQRTKELLEDFSLTASADKALADFSGGMRRRLDLAVSLITRPELVFLDEPTTGLDPRTRVQMWQTIRQLVAQGSTILLTTQYLDEADELADRIAVIDHGKLVRIGTPAELKQQVGHSTMQLAPTSATALDQLQRLMTNILHESATIDNDLVTAKLASPSQATDILIAIRQAGISLKTVTVQEPTLDDVFFNLTVGTN